MPKPPIYNGCPVGITDANGEVYTLAWVDDEAVSPALSSHVWIRFMDGHRSLFSVRRLTWTEIDPNA